ncbi:hypothetical protein Trydic_g18722 [Trypoxylus dichotomus]
MVVSGEEKNAHWSVDDWSKILWSDESNIELVAQPDVEAVGCRSGEAFHPDCITLIAKHSGDNLMSVNCTYATGV